MDLRQLPRRAVILGFGVSVAIAGAVVIGILYLSATISMEAARLWLLALGVLVNGLLVSAYVFTLLDTQRRIERAEKRPQYSDILEEILDPAIETVQTNRQAVKRGNINWFNAPKPGGDISTVAPDSASLAAQHSFESEFARVSEDLDRHDTLVHELNELASELQGPTESEIEAYVRCTRGLPMNQVNQKVFAYSILNQADSRSVQDQYKEEWQAHREGLLSIRENEPIRESIERFDSLREDNLDQSETLLDELVELKQELRTKIQLP